jgi:TonB family protein
MRLAVASSALAAAVVLTHVVAGYAPALCQDFSITNQMAPAIAGHPNLMRQLQAWWDVHAYYPRHASNNDEGGIVKLHLAIRPDGRLWTVEVVDSSGSHSLDAASVSIFRDLFVRPFPQGETQADIDLSLHYVLAHRHDQPVPVNYTPVSSKTPFTIMNDPVKSPILETMLRRVCTGTEVRSGIKDNPLYGIHYSAEAIFFRKPDGTPWVRFDFKQGPVLAPVTEVGKLVQFAGKLEYAALGHPALFPQYTLWPDGDNHLTGVVGSRLLDRFGVPYTQNAGSLDLTCTTEVLPAVAASGWSLDTGISWAPPPPGDPP